MAKIFILKAVFSGPELNVLLNCLWSTRNNVQRQQGGCLFIKDLVNRHTTFSHLFYSTKRTPRKYFKMLQRYLVQARCHSWCQVNCRNTRGKAVWCMPVIEVLDHCKLCTNYRCIYICI